jgi:hypothetical protein
LLRRSIFFLPSRFFLSKRCIFSLLRFSPSIFIQLLRRSSIHGWTEDKIVLHIKYIRLILNGIGWFIPFSQIKIMWYLYQWTHEWTSLMHRRWCMREWVRDDFPPRSSDVFCIFREVTRNSTRFLSIVRVT